MAALYPDHPDSSHVKAGPHSHADGGIILIVDDTPMNAILPTGFRNVALALTFANIVFPHTDASSFLFTMSIVMLTLGYITFSVLKRWRKDATA